MEGTLMFRKSLTTLKEWKHAAELLPWVSYTAFRHGALPLGISTLKTLKKEGARELHWKVTGDALMRFCRESGPVLTKVGQILSTRHDLLPEAVCDRLETLYSEQAPMSKRRLRRLLKKAYPKEYPFQSFNEKAIGVGSVGQVHRARLKNNTPVIVKIVKSGIDHQIRRDMGALKTYVTVLLGLPTKRFSATRFLIKKILSDLEEGFLKETDLNLEAKSLQEFGKRFKKNPDVRFPRCYAEFSDARFLVMEELVGEPLSEYRKKNGAQTEEIKAIADKLITEILKQIFEEGKFHADPHPGNILVLNDGRIGFIDLGLVGEFGVAERRNISKAIKAFVSKDAEGVIRALLSFGVLPPGFDQVTFKKDIVEVVKKHKKSVTNRVSGKSNGKSNGLEEFVNALFRVASLHRVYIPPSSTLLIKTLVTIEGVARSLDPDLNLVKVALPVILRSLMPRWMRWFG